MAHARTDVVTYHHPSGLFSVTYESAAGIIQTQYPSFFPPVGSDNLFDNLRTAYPSLSDHSKRLTSAQRDAEIWFASVTRMRLPGGKGETDANHVDSKQATGSGQTSSSPDGGLPSPPRLDTAFEAGSVGSTGPGSHQGSAVPGSSTVATSVSVSCASESGRLGAAHSRQVSNPTTNASVTRSPPTQADMTFQWKLESAPELRPGSNHGQPSSNGALTDRKPNRAHFKRALTEEEKVEFKRRRRIGACADCRKKKKRCTHEPEPGSEMENEIVAAPPQQQASASPPRPHFRVADLPPISKPKTQPERAPVNLRLPTFDENEFRDDTTVPIEMLDKVNQDAIRMFGGLSNTFTIGDDSSAWTMQPFGRGSSAVSEVTEEEFAPSAFASVTETQALPSTFSAYNPAVVPGDGDANVGVDTYIPYQPDIENLEVEVDNTVTGPLFDATSISFFGNGLAIPSFSAFSAKHQQEALEEEQRMQMLPEVSDATIRHQSEQSPHTQPAVEELATVSPAQLHQTPPKPSRAEQTYSLVRHAPGAAMQIYPARDSRASADFAQQTPITTAYAGRVSLTMSTGPDRPASIVAGSFQSQRNRPGFNSPGSLVSASSVTSYHTINRPSMVVPASDGLPNQQSIQPTRTVSYTTSVQYTEEGEVREFRSVSGASYSPAAATAAAPAPIGRATRMSISRAPEKPRIMSVGSPPPEFSHKGLMYPQLSGSSPAVMLGGSPPRFGYSQPPSTHTTFLGASSVPLPPLPDEAFHTDPPPTGHQFTQASFVSGTVVSAPGALGQVSHSSLMAVPTGAGPSPSFTATAYGRGFKRSLGPSQGEGRSRGLEGFEETTDFTPKVRTIAPLPEWDTSAAEPRKQWSIGTSIKTRLHKLMSSLKISGAENEPAKKIQQGRVPEPAVPVDGPGPKAGFSKRSLLQRCGSSGPLQTEKVVELSDTVAEKGPATAAGATAASVTEGRHQPAGRDPVEVMNSVTEKFSKMSMSSWAHRRGRR